MRLELGPENAIFVHVTLVPFIPTAGELKTKPTQHSVKEMLSIGIQPDLLLCRSDRPLPREMKAKIALFCNIAEAAVITAQDVDTIYEVPLALAQRRAGRADSAPAEAGGAGRATCRRGWDCSTICTIRRARRASAWWGSTSRWRMPTRVCARRCCTAGWRTGCARSSNGSKPKTWIRRRRRRGGWRTWTASWCRADSASAASKGMIHTIRYARESKVPFFGICLGMQCASIEYARNVAGLAGANSTEFDPQTPHRVIYKLRELLGVDEMGGTMRLGAWPCHLEPGSLAAQAYGSLEISERHRHRYEFNGEYEQTLAAAGLRISGRTPDRMYVEIVEVPDHPWFLGCQFHPEFKSKPLAPHPLFAAFVGAAVRHRKGADRPAARGVRRRARSPTGSRGAELSAGASYSATELEVISAEISAACVQTDERSCIAYTLDEGVLLRLASLRRANRESRIVLHSMHAKDWNHVGGTIRIGGGRAAGADRGSVRDRKRSARHEDGRARW